jgi:hypothetical protein
MHTALSLLTQGNASVDPFGPFQGTDRFATKVSLVGSIEVADKLRVLEMANPSMAHASLGSNLPLAHIDGLLASWFNLWPTTPVTQVFKALWARNCLTHFQSVSPEEKNLPIAQIYEKYRQQLEVERQRYEELVGQLAQELFLICESMVFDPMFNQTKYIHCVNLITNLTDNFIFC